LGTEYTGRSRDASELAWHCHYPQMQPGIRDPQVLVCSPDLVEKKLTVAACSESWLQSYRLVIRIEMDRANDPQGQRQETAKEYGDESC
jgi:hypothetical protein